MNYYFMKQEEESFVSDLKIYSEGLVLALQNDKFGEILDYVEKMRPLLDSVSKYAEMKKRI